MAALDILPAVGASVLTPACSAGAGCRSLPLAGSKPAGNGHVWDREVVFCCCLKELTSCFHLEKTCFSQERGSNSLHLQGLVLLARLFQWDRKPGCPGEVETGSCLGLSPTSGSWRGAQAGESCWRRSWAPLGAFPSASVAAATPQAGPEHPTATGNGDGTNTARRGASAVGRMGIKAP